MYYLKKGEGFRMKKTLITLAATAFTVLATLVATSACFWGWYQPEEPKALRDE